MSETRKKNSTIQLRVTEEERAAYDAAANRDKRTRGDWMRFCLGRVVGHKQGKLVLHLSATQAKNILALISSNQDEGWHVGEKQRWRESLKDIESQIVEQIG